MNATVHLTLLASLSALAIAAQVSTDANLQRKALMRRERWRMRPTALKKAQRGQEGLFLPATNSTNSSLPTDMAGGIQGVDPADKQAAATCLGMVLLGSVAFIMTLFYGVNFPDPEIRHVTWKMLSEVSACFCAVLLFSAFKDVMVYEFDETGGAQGDDGRNLPPDLKSLIMSFVRLIVLVTLVQLLLIWHRHNNVKSHAWGKIGGITCAFAAIDAFGMVQELEPFRNSPGMAFLAWCLAAFVYASLCWSTSTVRDYFMVGDDGTVREEDLQWHHACIHSENIGAGIFLGLLLSAILRFTITGSLPALDGSPKGKTRGEITELTLMTFGLIIPLVALCGTIHAMERLRPQISSVVRGVEVIAEIVAKTMAWCFIFLGRWIFWSQANGSALGVGDKMSARVMCAFVGSYVAFLLIFLIDFVADRMKAARKAFDTVIHAILMAMAVSWQCAFRSAVKAIGETSDNQGARTYTSVGLSILLCSIIIPAWLWYMLPMDLAGPVPSEKGKTQEEQKEEANAKEGSTADNKQDEESKDEAAGDVEKTAAHETGEAPADNAQVGTSPGMATSEPVAPGGRGKGARTSSSGGKGGAKGREAEASVAM